MTSRAALGFALALAAVPLLGADPAVPALRATGTLVVHANLQGQPLDIGGNVALFHRGTRSRLDVLSLGLPGTSGDLSALAATLIAPGGVSVLYDGATGTLTAWSNANRTYYTAAPAPRTIAPGSFSSPGADGQPLRIPPPGTQPVQFDGSDPLAMLASVSAALHDVQSATIQLVGHGPVNGHPATNLDVQVRRQLPGRALENYHAQLALADDLSGFPVQITVQSTPATPSAFGGTLRLDLTAVQAAPVDDATLAVPSGYTRADSFAAVLRR